MACTIRGNAADTLERLRKAQATYQSLALARCQDDRSLHVMPLSTINDTVVAPSHTPVNHSAQSLMLMRTQLVTTA